MPIVTRNGGSSPFIVMGPYAITKDTAGLLAGGTELADLAVGAVVVRAWVIVTADWVSAAPSPFDVTLDIGIGTTAVGFGRIVTYPDLGSQGNTFAWARYESGSSALTTAYAGWGVGVVQQAGQKLIAQVHNFGAALVTGQGNVYALVYTP